MISLIIVLFFIPDAALYEECILIIDAAGVKCTGICIFKC
jgi:hypothetical protein